MTANTWPGKPGVPLNPERDGPHWLCHNEIDQEEAALWDAKGNFWQLIGTDDTFSPRDLVVRKWGYLGPVLTPDETTALQARVAELEGALRFYADPFKYTDIHGDDVRVPHFYSETDFGETARIALGLDKPWTLQP